MLNLETSIVIITRPRDKIVASGEHFNSTTFMSSSIEGWAVPASSGTSRGFGESGAVRKPFEHH
jgi:hypothetical protein